MNGASAENEVIKLMESWRELEKQILETTTQILERAKSDVIKLIFDEMKRDSEKNLKILEKLMNFERRELSLEELAELASLLTKQERIEMESINVGDRVLRLMGEEEVTAKLIQHILGEKQRHYEVLRDFILTIYSPE